ncbi:MAG: glycosyltransferase [Candidatus Dormibacteria bacterium]
MFSDVPRTPLPYSHPWNATLLDRRRSLARGSRRIAYVYERPDTSTFRYRVFNMVEALSADPALDTGAAWFTLAEVCDDQSFVDTVDVLILCRVRYSDPVVRLVSRARAHQVRVLFDVDDLVCDSRFIHMICETLDVSPRGEEDWDHWFAYVARMEAMLRCCDGAIATTPALARHLSHQMPGFPVATLANFLNRAQGEVSRRLLEGKTTGGYRRDAQVTIGYLSGTPSHNRDFQIVAPALAELMDRFHQVRLCIVGFMAIPSVLAPLADRIDTVPLQDFLNLQRWTAGMEICLAPLQRNAFTECKSELKFFEAGAVGVPLVATPTDTMSRAITHGRNGFLCLAQDWYPCLETIARDLVDGPQDWYQGVSGRAAEDAFAHHSWVDRGRAVVDALEVAAP